MERILIADTPKFINQEVLICGWHNNLRALGKVNFLIVRDRTGLAQVVVQDKEQLKKLDNIGCGSILNIKAKVIETKNTELGIELIDPEIDVQVPINEVPPVEYYKADFNAELETILDHRAIALRNRKIAAVFRIQAEIAHAYRLYMHDVVGASEYFAPNLIGASSEGGSEFFKVDYFGHTATLAQSSQLYKQIMVGVNERVYALMPFFRAENSNTVRHLTEGKQLEFEMGFFEHWHEVLDVHEGVIKYIVKYINERCAKDIQVLGGDIVKTPENIPFPRLTFAEAQELVYKRTNIDERHEADLSPSSERELCKWAIEEKGTDCVFVIDWKTSKRPFYAYPKDDNPELSNTFDLLCAGSEITSGGQRRHTYDSMLEGIRSKDLNPDDFPDYLSIFKHGMPAHGGFGLGLERLTMTILKLKNIREASLFPSDPKRIAGNRIKAKIFFGDQNIRNEIIRRLKQEDMQFRHLTHEATPTSEESARVRGTSIESGIKALVLVGKKTKKNYMFNLQAHLKLDMKAVGDIVGEKCEFEDPQVIKTRYGLIVGGVPPFASLLGMESYFDEGIKKLGEISFNCGLQTESIVMQASDLISLNEPKLAIFSKA